MNTHELNLYVCVCVCILAVCVLFFPSLFSLSCVLGVSVGILSVAYLTLSVLEHLSLVCCCIASLMCVVNEVINKCRNSVVTAWPKVVQLLAQ